MTRDRRPRVLIADDHGYTRAGIRAALEADEFAVCAEVATGRQAVEQVSATRPDIALLDVHMPDGTGIWAAEQIRELGGTAVVLLTYSREEADVLEGLRAGAVGYLLKDMDPDRLGQSLRNVLAGEIVLPRSLMSKVVSNLPDPVRGAGPGIVELTPRESEVAALLPTGASTESIATDLSMAEATVRVHIGNILKKYGAANRQELITMLRRTPRDA